MSNVNGPIPQEWGGYVTQSNVGLEVIPAVLYDTQTYVDNTTVQLPFFTSSPANEAVSNVSPPSILPNPEAFLIKNIFWFVPNELETGQTLWQCEILFIYQGWLEKINQ